MRVVAGVARGRRLSVPEGETTRPASSRAREAVFNSLHSLDMIKGSSVLDLYAGTGALGIEALSRGAAEATFVEHDKAAIRCLKKNLSNTDLTELATVITADVYTALTDFRLSERVFDLAIVDPPYTFTSWECLLQRIPAKMVVALSDHRITMQQDWKMLRHKSYGRTVVTYGVKTTVLKQKVTEPAKTKLR